MRDPTSLLIDPRRLLPLLAEAAPRFDVDALAECGSTNTLLLARADAGAASGSVIVADRQTDGRGSRGRRWLASPEASLTFSLLWRFAGGFEAVSGLSLAVGLAIVRGLEACAVPGVLLKWPNDIVHSDAKLGGILVELQSQGDAVVAVIGIGLNLKLPDFVDCGENFALAPTALAAIVATLPERHQLFASLLGELARILDRFERGGFAVLRDEWQARNAWQNRSVRMLREGRVEKEGICRGADRDGALLVQTAAGIERCVSGELSLRPL